jgi:steroid delta-isomerase-like uncharacterized protein
MTISTREAFERGTDAFNAHDVDGFAQVLADDVTFAAPGGMRGTGKAGCVEFYAGWFAAFPDAHVDVTGIHVLGDAAVEEGTFTGTHEGTLHAAAGDLPPTGRSVSVDYIQVLNFRAGKHVSFNLMFDRLQMLEQLGLIAAAASAT